MRISDWSSDVCSSDLHALNRRGRDTRRNDQRWRVLFDTGRHALVWRLHRCGGRHPTRRGRISTHRRRDQTQVGSYLMMHEAPFDHQPRRYSAAHEDAVIEDMRAMRAETYGDDVTDPAMDITPLGMVLLRSEEHTSEHQSLMRISYAVYCLKKKKTTLTNICQKTTN